MAVQVVVLGAGFGGLELASRLSDALGAEVRVTLIDRNDAFVFGFAKFEIMLGRKTRDEIAFFYRDLLRPGVEFRQETVLAIDPVARRVTTDRANYEGDFLVIALGAEYDYDQPPGFAAAGHEFYSVAGVERLAGVLPAFSGGRIVIGVLALPYKCPPAPCEGAMLLDQYFRERGIREAVSITVLSPWPVPVPASPTGSAAILERFHERGLEFIPNQAITALDPVARTVHLRDGEPLPYDLFLGIPVHRVPAVVAAAGLAEGGWIAVDRERLTTRFPNVYAIGDVTSMPVPKAGVFAEGGARAVADQIVARVRGEGEAAPYDGAGACFIEFGDHRVGRINADFATVAAAASPFTGPTEDLAREKVEFASTRRQRWGFR